MKRFPLKSAILATLIIIAAQSDTKEVLGQNSLGSQPERKILAPVLGNYPNTSLQLSTDATVTPDAAPTNTTRITVSSSTNFKGRLEGYPATGVVRMTDAHPAGTYVVTVRAFDSSGASTTKTFMLTVTTLAPCNPVSFAAAANFGVGSAPRLAAVGDFNGDGKQDLAVANFASHNVSILLGNGAGSFGTATNFGVGIAPQSVAVGDFNGDGNQDLAVTNDGSNNVSILLGDSAGSFSAATNFSAGTAPLSIAVGDFNGDGNQDLAVVNIGSNNVSILLGDGTGNFIAPTNFPAGTNPYSVAVGDFNGDGNQDLAVADRDSSNVSVLLGDGAGNFSAPKNFPPGTNPYSVAVGDFNGDGNQDLAVANYSSNNVSILLGDGAGNFSAARNFTAGNNPISVAVGDFNGDGNQDLAVANGLFNGTVSILLGNGAGSFSVATNSSTGTGPFSAVVGDFNGDGKQDLAVTNSQSDNVSILLRNCTSAISRKIHGGAGPFDINLPLNGIPGIECRSGGATSDYTVLIAFPGAVSITGNPQAQVTSGTGTVGSGGMSNGGMVTISGNVVTIPLTNVANAQTINATLYGVNGDGNLIIPMRLLTGDVNGNGAVNASDVALAKARTGQPVDATDFCVDVNANGVINATDVSLVKSNVGSGVSMPEADPDEKR